jgi:hypothetical protein
MNAPRSRRLRRFGAFFVTLACVATVLPLPSVIVHRHEHGETNHIHGPIRGHSGDAATHDREFARAPAHHHSHAGPHQHTASDATGDRHETELVAAQPRPNAHRHVQAPFLSSLAPRKVAPAASVAVSLLQPPGRERPSDGARHRPRSRGPPATTSL